MIKSQEIEIMTQFFNDGKKGMSGTFNLDENVANKTKILIDKLSSDDIKSGNICVNCNFSSNGGTFTLVFLNKETKYTKANLKNESIYTEIRGKEKGVLIEPLDYGKIEPYNRQQPFYFPYPYDRLNKIEFSNFKLFTSPTQKNGGFSTRFDPFYYNDFWKTISFSMFIEPDKVEQFFNQFFILYRMENMTEKIIHYINE